MTISFIHKSQSSLGQTARMKKMLLRYLLKCLKTISRGFIGNLTQHTAGSARVHLMIWWETMAISQGSIEEHLTTYATFNSRRQSLLLLSLNLAGYDYHLFVNNFSKTEGNIKCIPNKMRKITSASAKMSLLTLSSTKVKKLTSKMSFTLIKASSSWLLFSKGTEKVFMEKIKLVSRKGVYPYDYTDSITKFDVTELPPKDKFYSKLNDCDISNEDYEHTQNLWN